MDIAMICIGVGFFVLSLGLAVFCDSLREEE